MLSRSIDVDTSKKTLKDSIEKEFPCLNLGILNPEKVKTTHFQVHQPRSSFRVMDYQRVNIPGKGTHILGEGGFGEVWLVEHKTTKQKYAMKVLNRDKLAKNLQMKTIEQEI